MAHLFEGQPDGRQSEQPVTVSRFRPQYRPLLDHEKALHDEIKAAAVHLECLFNRVPSGRYSALAMTALEQSVMWAIKQLTA